MDFSESDARSCRAIADVEHAESTSLPINDTGPIRIRVSQARPGMSPTRTVVAELVPDSRTRIACANPSCRGGGLDPLPVVRELIGERRGVLRVESCGGRQRRPGGALGARCDTMFCIRLDDDFAE